MSLPDTIEAITIPKVRLLRRRSTDVHDLQHGGVEVIEKTTLPFPEVKPGEIVIKVTSERAKRLIDFLLGF